MSSTRFLVICRFIASTVLLLAGSAAPAEEPRTDSHGDPLPPGAIARLGTSRLRQFNVDSLTFTKDGKRLLTCSERDRAICIWDASTGKLLESKPFPGKPGENERVSPVTLLPGGTRAQAYLDHKAFLYDIATGKEQQRLGRYGMLSLDGKILLTKGGELWDVKTDKLRHKLSFSEFESFWEVIFTPDGKRLIGITKTPFERHYEDGSVRIWDTTTGVELSKKNDKRVRAESLALSPDGKTLALGGNELTEVSLLDAATLKEIGTLPAATNLPKGLAFSPDGRFLAGAGGRGEWDSIGRHLRGTSVALWDLKGKKEPRHLITADVTGRFAFTPDSKTLACSCSWGSEIFLWDTATGRRLLEQPGHGTAVYALAVSPDGQLAASIARDGIYLWKTATGEPLHKLSSRDDRKPVCFFSPDNKQLISAGPGGSIQVWSVSSGKELRRFRLDAPDDRTPVTVENAGISLDGKRLSAIFSIGRTYRGQPSNNDGRLLVWDLTSGKELLSRAYKLESHPLKGTDGGWSVPLAPAQAQFCAAFDPPPQQAWGTVHAGFAPGGDVVSVWLGKQVGLEEVSSGRRLASLPRGIGRKLLISPDGRLIAAAVLRGDELSGSVSLIETATGEEIVRLEISSSIYGHGWAIDFTPDSRGLAVANRTSLRILDTASGERLHEMAWPESLRNPEGEVHVSSLAMLPGGRAITGMGDGQVLVWDLAPASWKHGQPIRDLDRKELDRLWSDLAADPRKGQRALHALASAPAQSLPFLRDHLQPTTAVDSKRIETLLADLESKKFSTREAAVRELTELRERIEPLLQQTLKGKPTLETRRRLEALLAEPLVLPARTQRTLRAIATLERIGTPEARGLLEKLSAGMDAAETRAARAALDRLKLR